MLFLYKPEQKEIMNRLKQFANIFHTLLITKTSGKKHFKGLDAHINEWSAPSIPAAKSVGPVVTWLGQSGFLIQIENINIITDPSLFDLPPIYKRLLPSGVESKHLPKIDIVLISHNHRDHMDEKSLNAIKQNNPHILFPQGNKRWFQKRNLSNAHEFKWHEKKEFEFENSKVKLTFLPTKHWTCRNFIDINKTSCGSWMIETPHKTIYFGGDSAYDTHYKKIAQYFPNIDIALMPIGPTGPRKLVAHAHLDAQEAGKAFLDLNATHFFPMHWGTYQLAPEQFDAPIVQLKNWWKNNNIKLDGKTLHVVKCGEQKKF